MRVLVVDDSASFRETLRLLLEGDPRIEVVGEAANGAEALVLVAELQPDLVTIDLEMPVMGGIEATAAIRRDYPQIPVVVVTGSSFTGNPAEAAAAGVVAIVSKADVAARLTEVIVRAASEFGGSATRPHRLV